MANIYRTGAIALVASIIVSVIFGIISLSAGPTNLAGTAIFSGIVIANLVLNIILMGMFFFAIAYMGKRHGVNSLYVTAWLRFAVLILAALVTLAIVAGLITSPALQYVYGNAITGTPFDPDTLQGDLLVDFLITMLIVHVVNSLVTGVVQIFFGVSLLKLKDRVPYSRPSGVLEIIAGATLIILIGGIIGFVAQILELIMLFKIAKKEDLGQASHPLGTTEPNSV